TGYTGVDQYIPWYIYELPIYMVSAIPVGIFYYVLFLIQPDHQLQKWEKIGFWILAVNVFLDSLYLLIDGFIADETLNETLNNYVYYGTYIYLIICAWYLLLQALKRVNQYQKFLYDNYSNPKENSLQWLKTILLASLALLIPFMVGLILELTDQDIASEVAYVLMTTGMMILLFWMGYAIILKYNWFEVVPYEVQATEQKLSDKTQVYYEHLLQLIQEEKLYQDANLNLNRLSEKLDISSGYLSKIIQEQEQKNFFEFINFYRVEAVKTKLSSNEYHHLTIMAIAEESGFKSRSTFYTVFKKFTGQTPAAFRQAQGA
ncbi:MAG: AraC family transcriptional regulator, partial [Bacteroidota bacterium]